MFENYPWWPANYSTWVQVIELIVGLIGLVSYWKIYVKANKPGWAAIVPIYSAVVMCQIAGKPTWWVILMFIPVVNIIVGLAILNDLLKTFGKMGLGYFFGTIFLPFIFLPMLAFGKAQYTNPTLSTVPVSSNPPIIPPVNPPTPTPGQ